MVDAPAGVTFLLSAHRPRNRLNYKLLLPLFFGTMAVVTGFDVVACGVVGACVVGACVVGACVALVSSSSQFLVLSRHKVLPCSSAAMSMRRTLKRVRVVSNHQETAEISKRKGFYGFLRKTMGFPQNCRVCWG